MVPRPGCFVTGTDTGVGKTAIATALVRSMAESGARVVGLKPVASGATRTPDGLRNADAVALAAASSVPRPYELTNPYCFEAAIAPHIAAADAGISMALPKLVDWYGTATAGADVAIIEGAGGWRLPLHPDGFLSDLPERLGLGIILVVGLRLGCLNHARLTVEAIVQSGQCPFVGWIGNSIDPDFARPGDNVAELCRLLDRPPLAIVPFLSETSPDRVVPHLRGEVLTAVRCLAGGRDRTGG